MKLHLPTTLLSALLALVSVGNAATYVLPEDVANGTRFFDVGKGSKAWLDDQAPFENGKVLYSSGGNFDAYNGSYKFLGELQNKLYKQTGQTSYFYGSNAAFSTLRGDPELCWGYAASNIIQYWQSTYGVFYKGEKELAHGYTYDKANLEALGGTQSLKVGMQYFDNWERQQLVQGEYNGVPYDYYEGLPGDLGVGLAWYMDGSIPSLGSGGDRLKEGADAGGYFSTYFSEDPSVKARGVSSRQNAATCLAAMMGYEKSNGAYTRTVEGHIAGMSIYYPDGGGHGLTIYGFEVDGSGNLVSLQIADSDDVLYGLRTLYVDSSLNLYYDYDSKEGTYSNPYNNTGAYISTFYSIQTSQTLINMRADYDGAAKSRALVWSGGHEWNTKVYDEAEYLPSSKSPWTVYVNAGNTGYYASYFDSGRDVLFDDSASDTEVTLSEDVSVGSMRINNTSKDYSFSGSKTVTATSLSKESSGAATFSETKLVVDGATTVSGGLLQFESSAAAALKDVNLSNGKMLLQRGEGNTASPTLTAGAVTLSGTSSLALADQSTAALDSLTVAAAPNDGTAAVTLAGASQLTVEGALDISRGTVALANTTAAASGNHLKAGAVTVNGTGTLALSGSSVATFDSLTIDNQGALNMSGSARVNATVVEVKSGTLVLAASSRLNATDKLSVSNSANVSIASQNLEINTMEVKNDAGLGYTIQESGGELQLSYADMGTTETGGYLRAAMSNRKANLGISAITVAEEAVFTLAEATVSMDTTITGNAGSTLAVDDVVFYVDASGAQGASLDANTVLASSNQPSTVTLVSTASVYEIKGEMLQSLDVMGSGQLSDLTLWFASYSDYTWYETVAEQYDFLAISFAETVSFDMDSLAVKGRGLVAGSELLDAYYVQPKARGAGQVSTLYFALGDIPTMAVPEPTTATLSLLALAALAARRRRR